MKFALSVPDWVPHWRSYFPILDVLGRHRPFLFPFARILFWGQLPG